MDLGPRPGQATPEGMSNTDAKPMMLRQNGEPLVHHTLPIMLDVRTVGWDPRSIFSLAHRSECFQMVSEMSRGHLGAPLLMMLVLS